MYGLIDMKALLNHIIMALAAAGVLAACSEADMDYVNGKASPDAAYAESGSVGEGPRTFDAIVTVRKAADDTVYFQLTEDTRVFPLGYDSPYERPRRLMCSLTKTGRSTGAYGLEVSIGWMDFLDEGNISGSGYNGGDDPIDLVSDWMTSVEDGFLTLHYSTSWGLKPVAHVFTLLTGTDPSDPYLVVLRHDSRGDRPDTVAEGLICFDLSSLPDTGGQYKPLTLKWTCSDGASSERTFEFRSRQ